MDKKSSAEVEVEVQVLEPFAGLVSAERLRWVAEAVLRLEGEPGQASLVITDDESIQGLNRDYLGQNNPTDVLAFSAREDAGSFVVAPEAQAYLGDVVVSYPRAVAQAAEAGSTVEEELHLLIVHGVLHLLGYDHAEEEDKAAMWARQEAILRSLASP
jgi:probable rRNA maturation factor